VPTQKIDDFLNDNHQRFSPLQKLLQQDRNREAWTQEFRAVLPKPLRAYCQITDMRGPVLHVTCQNAAVATKLRFLSPSLLPKLRTLGHFSQLSELQIRVVAS